MINTQQIINNLQSELLNLTEDLIIILGPTASGKTKLAVELAQIIDAEIISVDSRQVYRGMDIGTGKDLSEYKDVPYHLIDILNPGEKYNISLFLEDFEIAFKDIRSRSKKVIACGGTGFYLQALLEAKPYTQIPINLDFRSYLQSFDKDILLQKLDSFSLPQDFIVDRSSKKRIVRAIEILTYLNDNPGFKICNQPTYSAKVFGLNPELNIRRERISNRLLRRLEDGLIREVEGLLMLGVTHEELQYYGLEYKYVSYYLSGDLNYDEFFTKLETEIHRYAKRQMTFFRKIEKDGILIRWFV